MTMQSAAPDDRPETVLDPLNEVRIAKEYDLNLGYLVHHYNSIDAGGGLQRPRLTDLLTKGYEVVPALDSAAAAHVVNIIKKAPKNPLSAATIGNVGLKSLLEMVLQGELDQRLRSTFLSNYGVIFADFFACEPGYHDWSSFWHCDAGPESHVKVIVYLNSATEHDGATQFLDVNTTRLFRKIGYVFCRLNNRQPDLDHIAEAFDITYEPDTVRPDTGQAIVLHPGQVLHKALSPTHGVRYTLNLGIIPSVPDWRSFYDTSFKMLATNTGGAFPDLS